jgi:predicted permease
MRVEHWLYSIPLRLRSLFRRKQLEQELDEELQFHLEHKIEEHIAKGLSPEQARRTALREMDGLTQRKEECREARGVMAIENTVQDIRYGLRILAKSPGFTTVAVLTLALAIGANAVVFGILNALVLRPLNVPDGESLYVLQHGNDHMPGESYPDYLDLRERNRSFDDLAAYSVASVGLDTDGNPVSSWCQETSGNYFDVLRIQPHLGRFFHSADEHGPNSAPYVVLSYAFWQNRFSGDPNTLGRVVRINKHPFTVIGVAPPDFHGTLFFASPDFFVPMVNQEQVRGQYTLNARGQQAVFMTIGHVKAGVTTAQAIADLNAIGADLAKTYPKEHTAAMYSLGRPILYGDYFGRPVKAFLTALMLLAGLVLLAACANLGSLFAARAADRSREVALRLALGSSRGRILRGLFTEAGLISIAGGGAGLLGSVFLLRALSAWQPVARYPNFRVPVQPDAHVYLVALALAVVSALLFGVVPVRQAMGTDPYEAIKSGSRTVGTARRRFTFRDLLLGAQIAICAVLVTSSMVAVRALVRSLHSDFGFEPRHAMLLETNLGMAGYGPEQTAATQRRIVETVEKIPGVLAVGLVDWMPLEGAHANAMPVFGADATDFRPANALSRPAIYRISPDYFRAAGTALLAGRGFTWHDDKDAPRVAIVNRVFARKVFGAGARAEGRSFKLADGARVQVVGIAEDGKYASLTEDARAAMFLPIQQAPTSISTLVARSNGDAQQLAIAMRNAVRSVDAGLPMYIETWQQELDLALFPSRMATVSLGVLGLIGAMLSVTGIFGMAAYSVSRRLRELGIRMALGAQRQEVLQAALGRALRLLAIGSAAGLALGILASRVLASIVYQATPRDPLVLTGVVVAMMLVGLLATWIPAQRALSLDPVTLLREE